MKLVISREASADIQRLRTFLHGISPASAARAVTVIVNAVGSLEFLPERGRPSGIRGVRELIVPFGNSAYVLRYAHLVKAGEIVILRIWHGREMRE